MPEGGFLNSFACVGLVVGAVCFGSGCMSLRTVDDNRSAGYGCGANGIRTERSEPRLCMFGTNEWTKVEVYPDGMPFRVLRGKINEEGIGPAIEEIGYGFNGEIIARQRYDDINSMLDYEGKNSSLLSKYWDGLHSIRHVVSSVSGKKAYSVYYYPESRGRLTVGIWSVDFILGEMDKLVFTFCLHEGRVLGDPEVKLHIGRIVELQQVSMDENDRINISIKMTIGDNDEVVVCNIIPTERTDEIRHR